MTHGRGFGCYARQILGGILLSHYDATTLGLSIFGLGINIVLALVSLEWRTIHKFIVNLGHASGFCLIGIGLYMLFLGIIPPSWGLSMWPKVSMIAGVIFFIGGAIWQFTSAGIAQTSNNDPNHVTGLNIVGNSQGGVAAEIVSNGLPGQPSVGADIRTVVGPGQSVTGVNVTQTGPGTGLRVIQTGPGVGLRSTVIVGPNGTENK